MFGKRLRAARSPKTGLAVAESFHLLEEALKSDCEIPAVFAAESVRAAVESHVRGLKKTRIHVLADDIFRSLSATESSQGVMALVRPPQWSLDQLFRGHSLTVVLDGLQDPGNAGAILRAAEAFGATGVAFLKGPSARTIRNACARRPAPSSAFRWRLALDQQLFLAAAEQRKIALFALMPSGTTDVGEVELGKKCAIIVGSEGRGVSELLRDKSTAIRIPDGGRGVAERCAGSGYSAVCRT